MEIEIGEYYRTESGYIDKIKSIDKQGNVFKDEKGKLQLWLGETIFGDPYSEEITKYSKNIIDLLEVGDIVELKEDIDMFAKSEKIGVSDTTMLNTIKESILERKIKLISILTHEQYEQNSFKL